MVAIIDYGAGNLGSVHKAFKYIGADVRVTSDPIVVDGAEALVLPGVGAFGHCMSGLASVRLVDSTRRFIQSGRPFLGICVGLQMLFEGSEETGATAGLGILRGRVVRFPFNEQRTMYNSHPRSTEETEGSRPRTGTAPDTHTTERLKVPHIGWNELEFRDDSVLFSGLRQGERVYFVHSYYPEPADSTLASAYSDYGGRFCCAVESGNVHATQFHPEKSGAAGLAILRNFASLAS